MISVVSSVALSGINGIMVSVEASATNSPKSRLDIIGLADTAVKEASGRVYAAARSSCVNLKKGVLTVNLAPADIKKEGSVYDLPILLSLTDDNRLNLCDISDKCFVGELSLTGEVRGIHGALAMAVAARENGFSEIYVPDVNAPEASAADGIAVYPVSSVRQLIDHLTGKALIEKAVFDAVDFYNTAATHPIDFSDVKGQEEAKKAAMVACAGNHNLLLIGSPGSGKSMIASRIPSILPPLTLREAIECTEIHSISGTLNGKLITKRPFRSPHHTASPNSLVGGGANPRPGEISLAHNGVLFLDEFTEFPKATREALRQPVENRLITVTRVNNTVTYPASFMLVCAMNPCKCGYFGHPRRHCTCSPASRHDYLSRISGPLLDRIDLHVEVPPTNYEDLHEPSETLGSAEMREKVIAARAFARGRFESDEEFIPNSEIPSSMMKKLCPMTFEAQQVLERSFEKMFMSARGHDKMVKIARTIADINESQVIQKMHVMTALHMRSLDKKYWHE